MLLLLVITALFFIPSVREFTQEAYVAFTSNNSEETHVFVQSLGWAAPLALIAAFILQAVIPMLPALVMVAVTGRAYPPLEAFMIIYIGTLLGAIFGYGLGRSVGNSLVRLLVGETTRRQAYQYAEKYGAKGVLMIRLMPILSADALNLVAGAARIPFQPFLLATAIGALPITLLVLWLSIDTERMLWGIGLWSGSMALAFLVRWIVKRNISVELKKSRG